MNKLRFFYSTVLVSLTLAGCSTTYNRDHYIERVITAHQLKNKTDLMIGYISPKRQWQCQYRGKQQYNWQLAKVEGEATFHLSNGYGFLRDKAISYANQYPKKHINYAYMYIPNQAGVMGINVTFLRKAQLTFYSCKKPPKEHKNPFKS